jgi:hypothetical protein
MTATATPPLAEVTVTPEVQSLTLRWPVKPLLAFLSDRPFEAGPVPLRLPLLDLVAAAVPDMNQALTARGVLAAGYPTWVITTGGAAGVDPSLDEVLVCRVDVVPVTREAGPVTS